MKRSGNAKWQGNLKNGKGVISTQSKTLNDSPYSFTTRFEQGQGTNPEELIAAAHAGCFSMALSALLEKAGFEADTIETNADVNLIQNSEGFSIPDIHLNVKAKISDISDEQFQKIATEAKVNCPVSKLFTADITMSAQLEA